VGTLGLFLLLSSTLLPDLFSRHSSVALCLCGILLSQSWTWVTFNWPDPSAHGPNPTRCHKLKKWDPTRPIATVRPTDLYAYLLVTFASVTDCLNNKLFIHECLIYTENNFSRTSNSLNCVNFTITLSVTFCIIQGDPHRPTQMDPTRPNPLSKEKIWTRLNPTRPDPTRGWTRSMSNSVLSRVYKCLLASRLLGLFPKLVSSSSVLYAEKLQWAKFVVRRDMWVHRVQMAIRPAVQNCSARPPNRGRQDRTCRRRSTGLRDET